MRRPSILRVSSKKNVVLRLTTEYHEITDMRISFSQIKHTFCYFIHAFRRDFIAYFFAIVSLVFNDKYPIKFIYLVGDKLEFIFYRCVYVTFVLIYFFI